MKPTRYRYRLKNVSPLSLASFKEIIPRIVYLNNDVKSYKMSRYTPYRIILNSNKKKYYETQNNTQIKSTDKDVFCRVTFENNRLDKIALQYYGDFTYWWIIAKVNNIIDPFDLPIDTVLRIPNINAVYASKGVVTNG